MTTDASIEAEWKAMAEAGSRRRRKALIPAIVGIGLFVVTTCGTFLGVASWAGERAQAREKALAAQGLEEVTVRYGRGGRRVVGKDEQARDAGVGLLALALAAGAAAGAAGFFATGGRLSAEHLRGIEQMRS